MSIVRWAFIILIEWIAIAVLVSASYVRDQLSLERSWVDAWFGAELTETIATNAAVWAEKTTIPNVIDDAVERFEQGPDASLGADPFALPALDAQVALRLGTISVLVEQILFRTQVLAMMLVTLLPLLVVLGVDAVCGVLKRVYRQRAPKVRIHRLAKRCQWGAGIVPLVALVVPLAIAPWVFFTWVVVLMTATWQRVLHDEGHL